MHDNIRLYHVDHLGSTSLVTDIDGEITQHVAYIPYGEVFVEERNGSWSTPYLFNAKELDEETGLYYYGARYLDPTHAAWLSVDPMFEKYVGMTPYNYCAGNPVGLVDPDGMKIKGLEDGDCEFFIEDVSHILSDSKFENFMNLLKVGKKQIQPISDKDKAEALKNLDLSDDEKYYINYLTDAINSEKAHYVNYFETKLSDKATRYFSSYMYSDPTRTKIINGFRDKTKGLTDLICSSGGGITIPLESGTASLSIVKRDGYTKSETAVTSMHEALGHGIPLANSSRDRRREINNTNAIQMDNLARRLLKMQQRDGSDHGGYMDEQTNAILIKNPYGYPLSKDK